MNQRIATSSSSRTSAATATRRPRVVVWVVGGIGSLVLLVTTIWMPLHPTDSSPTTHRNGANVIPVDSPILDSGRPAGLRIAVTGTVDTSSGFRSGSAGYALIIRGNERHTRSYAVGTEILPGVSLHAVSRDHILVKRDGVLEKIPLTQTLAVVDGNSGADVHGAASEEDRSSLTTHRSHTATIDPTRPSLGDYLATKGAVGNRHRGALSDYIANTGTLNAARSSLGDYRRDAERSPTDSTSRSLAEHRASNTGAQTVSRPLSEYLSRIPSDQPSPGRN